MPIKFRCVHCRHLLGIGRRKAGSWVVCPACDRPVRVPAPDLAARDQLPADAPRQSEPGSADAGRAIPPTQPAEAAPEPPPPRPRPISSGRLLAPATPANWAEADESPAAPRPEPGTQRIVLPFWFICWLPIFGLAALAAAFIAGLLLGRFVLRP